ncbi:MAG: phr [Thermoleophilia bacterium]|nr:phr [Thermoleophilia bacterium]
MPSAADHVTPACSVERLWSWNTNVRDPDAACVVYWMARSQRAVHNLAFDTAIATANELALPLVVLFNLSAGPPENDLRHVRQMLAAFPELAVRVVQRGAAFAVRGYGAPGALSTALTALRPAVVVTDEDAMPHARAARKRVAHALRVPLVSVDADVIVPNRVIGARQYAARTLRPRIHAVLAQFEGELGSDSSRVHVAWPADTEFADGVESWHAPSHVLDAAWVTHALDAARIHGIADEAGELDAPSGLAAARARLHRFIEHGLDTYADDRNQPHLDGTSGMSMFVHYGQIAPHEIVQAVRGSGARREGIDTFVEEFVVRRELAWNYALHTPDCRDWDALPEWARRTLEDHAFDDRPVIHSEAEMVACATRDPLWNAAQAQMRDSGLMHGYLRMYWAKQILTWTRTPQEAFEIALRLHDRYSLDARDPNSITGVSWAIGGVHDRAWPERAIFGKVRSMTFASTGRKFDKAAYIGQWSDGPVQLTLG